MDTDNYWSIDSLLAEEESMKVEFSKDIKYYGCITEDRQADAQKGMKSILPFWLSKNLFER